MAPSLLFFFFILFFFRLTPSPPTSLPPFFSPLPVSRKSITANDLLTHFAGRHPSLNFANFRWKNRCSLTRRFPSRKGREKRGKKFSRSCSYNFLKDRTVLGDEFFLARFERTEWNFTDIWISSWIVADLFRQYFNGILRLLDQSFRRSSKLDRKKLQQMKKAGKSWKILHRDACTR